MVRAGATKSGAVRSVCVFRPAAAVVFRDCAGLGQDLNRPAIKPQRSGYLFYLPFSMVFVSSDRLPRACAPLFLRPEQEFLWGQDLRADLRAHHDALMQLPEADRLRGLIALASTTASWQSDCDAA